MLRIYLDSCTLNRLRDWPQQGRVAQEAQAIREVLAQIRSGKALWVSSSVLEAELVRMFDQEKRAYVLSLLSLARERMEVTADVSTRAAKFQHSGLGLYDALHLACAEAAQCDILLSTDDRFLKRSQRVVSRVRLHNPIDWLRGTRHG